MEGPAVITLRPELDTNSHVLSGGTLCRRTMETKQEEPLGRRRGIKNCEN